MKNNGLKKFTSNVKKTLYKNSPAILIGVGIAGMVASTIMAVRATPKAMELINEKKEELNVDELGVVDTVKTSWKCYIPAATTGLLSTACIISSNRVNTKRNAAIATAYSMTENALREYQNKVIETIGEKKEKEVRDAVAKDKVEENKERLNTVVIAGSNDVVCMDSLSNQPFSSNMNKIDKAVNYLNAKMLNGDDYVCLNELYDELGIPHTELSHTLGWNVNKGLIDVCYSSIITADGDLRLVMSFYERPEEHYDEYY